MRDVPRSVDELRGSLRPGVAAALLGGSLLVRAVDPPGSVGVVASCPALLAWPRPVMYIKEVSAS